MRLSLICVAGCVLPGALALPSTPGGSSQHLEARAKVKLNQYRTMSDCLSDRAILYHAAPVSGRCYRLDGQTGAFFYNPSGYLQPTVYHNHNCVGIGARLTPWTGKCEEKGLYNSYKVY